MPDDKTVIGNIETVENGKDFGIKANDSPFALSFYFEDYYDDKAVKRFITSVERLIRTSKEYKGYIELLRTNQYALNHDNIMSNITTADVDLEFHHYPFSLYDLIATVMLKHISDKTEFTSFSIAKEVMELHYKHYIGLVPLTKTMHELAHSGSVFISEKQIFGDYHKFMELYEDGLSNELKNKVYQMESYSAQNIPTDYKGLLK